MKNIIISPYSKRLRNGKDNPKNYPFWNDIVINLNKYDFNIIQVGIKSEKEIEGVKKFEKNLPFLKLADMIRESDLFISVDNFIPHMCIAESIDTPGIVLIGQTNPKIFGYDKYEYLFSSEYYFRSVKDQFCFWDMAEYKREAFVDPEVVVYKVTTLFNIKEYK